MYILIHLDSFYGETGVDVDGNAVYHCRSDSKITRCSQKEFTDHLKLAYVFCFKRVRAQPAVIVPAPDLQQLVANNNINNSSEDPEEAEVVAADKAEETANACACISNTIDLAADASDSETETEVSFNFKK